ncbi:hypothetical protein CCR98_19820 [Stenotrophomonas sp. WZN-1]|nr:hypothetical protein CCR98_19820 [Stenotrophomonas sp. WZN-1]
MAGGTGGPYDVGVARSWPIFSVAAATTGGGPAGCARHRLKQRQRLGYPSDGRLQAVGGCRPWSTQ